MSRRENGSGPTLVSLFTGAGGLDVGLEEAGFRTVAAVDNDADCVETLRANAGLTKRIGAGRFLTGTKIIHGGIETIAPRDLRPAKCKRGWVPDLMVGGPPCQPFSSAGKMQSVEDPRGRLFEHFVRIAQDLRPRFVLFENVRGLVTAKGPTGVPGEALCLVKDAFEELGYATTFALLNAADYGSPQRRIRLFMLASRHSPLPSFPEATHSEQPNRSLFGETKPWVSLGEFLACQPAPSDEDVVRPSPRLAASLQDLSEGSGLKSPGIREATRPGGHWGYKQGTFIADPLRPARTVTAASTQDWVRSRDGSLRRLTWRECASLQGFPEEWEFRGRKASLFRQIGNAVPAVFGRVLGQGLYDSWMNGNPRKKVGSAPFPATFRRAVEYTLKEHRRNGESRTRALALIAAGRVSLAQIKGLGSEDHTPRD